MSVVRAKILAENYDKRRERERIMNAGSEFGPWWYGPLGFGAGLIGSLPDPWNLIPFSGGAITGVKLAGMTAKQVMANSLKKGIIEGVAGNLASSAYAAWDLNAKGENIGIQDMLTDTMFGAVAGPLFHGAGSFISRGMARRGLRADMGTLHGYLPEGDVHAGIGKTLEGMKRGDAGSYADAAPMLGELKKQDVVRFLRKNVTSADRMEIARAMEFALGEMAEGRAVDVSPILKETATLGRAWDKVRAEIDARTPAGKPGEVLVVLEPVGQEAMGVQRGPMVVAADGTVKAAGTEVAQQTGSKAGYGLTKVIIRHSEVTRADVMSIPRIMREYEPIAPVKGSHTGRTWVVERADGRQLVIGEAKQPDGGMLATVHLTDPGKERPLSQRKRSVKTLEGSAPQQFSAVSEDTGGGFPPGHTRSHQGEIKILRPGDDVNSNPVQKIDWSVAQPEQHSPLPPVSKETPNILHETGIDPKTGISHAEAHLTHLEAEGKLAPADRDALLAHTAEAERINALEEHALGIAECVMKVGV